MEQNTKLITCPEHKGDCKATLFCYPHKFSGIWECDNTGEGLSDTHEHGDYEIEEVEHMSSNPDSSYYTVERLYVCGGVDGCGEVIEDANPDEDRAEAIADMQIMEALGK